MASNRHLGRIIILQSLYEYEVRSLAGDATADINVIIAKNIEPYVKAVGDTDFIINTTKGILEHQEKLDQELHPLAPEWPLSSIAAIDRNILRLGLYELEAQAVPPKVAINESVELAKAFGSENSSKFVNGVLGTAYKQLGFEKSEGTNEQSKTSSVEGEKPQED